MNAKVEAGEVAATLYRSGPVSIAVTIPLGWARARGLKAGDRVILRLGQNLLLLTTPAEAVPGQPRQLVRNPEDSPEDLEGAFPGRVGGRPSP
jgi:hypothetical protein